MSRHVGRAAAWEHIPPWRPIPEWYYQSYDVVPLWAHLRADGSLLVVDRVRGGGGYERVVEHRPAPVGRWVPGVVDGWQRPRVLSGAELADVLGIYSVHLNRPVT